MKIVIYKWEKRVLLQETKNPLIVIECVYTPGVFRIFGRGRKHKHSQGLRKKEREKFLEHVLHDIYAK